MKQLVLAALEDSDANVQTENEEKDPTRIGAIVMEGKPKLAQRSPSQDFDRANAYANAETIKIPLHGWPRPFDCNARSYAILDTPQSNPAWSQTFKG